MRTWTMAGAQVPVVGQGTWEMERDPEAAVRALRRGLDLGMTHVDTAEMYGDGRVEAIVGEALEGRRDEVFLVTKVLPQNASRRGTKQACERSLERLKTDRVDLYLLHWEGPHPLADTFDAFEALREEGKIGAWGVSNFDEERLGEAARVAAAGQIACNQVLHHLRERAIEHAVLPWCREHGVPVVGYSPFGQGDFPEADSEGGRALAAVAAAVGATPRQVALAFLLRHVDFVIPKAAAVEHVEDNAGAAAVGLDDAQAERIDAAFPRGPRRRGVPTL